jgi:hypothetical protein
MSPSTRTTAVLAIFLLSTFIRSAFGFGDALVAMPLLTLAVGIHTAVPLVRLTGSTIALGILLGAWRRVEAQAAWRLVASSLVGVPFGFFLLKAAPEHLVTGILAAILIGFGISNLVALPLPTLPGERLSYLFGFIAGILGGAYNTNGPPIVMYGMMREWSPERFRATLQGYFLPTGVVMLIGQGLMGLYTHEVWRLYAYSLPVIAAAVVLGRWANKRLSGEKFKRLVYAFLIVIGVLLLASVR